MDDKQREESPGGMARKAGDRTSKLIGHGIDSLPPRGLRKDYFYLNGNLHRKISINRPADLLIAWSYPDRKRVAYVYSDAKRKMQQAFDVREVAALLNKNPEHIRRVIRAGAIETPQRIYPLDGVFKESKFKLNEDEIMELHDYFSTTHYGRPRKDGMVKPRPMPSKAELRAMMRTWDMIYVRDKQGNFVPVFKEVEWD